MTHPERERCTTPFIYEAASKLATLESWAVGSQNTEVDHSFIKPGTTRPFGLVAVRVQGKGSNLNSLSGISIRMKAWTTASSATVLAVGSSALVTPPPKNKLAPACGATCGMTSVTNGLVTNGGGGPLMVGYASCGASGPGGWVAINPDDVPLLDGGAAMSLDLFSSSGTANLLFEAVQDFQEA